MTEQEASQQDFSDEALDRAAEAVKPEETETPAEEPATEEPAIEEPETATEEPVTEPQESQRDEENAERSKLGRKVKSIEEKFETGFSEIMQRLESISKPSQTDEAEEEDAILTPQNADKHFERFLQKREREFAQYGQDFEKTFVKLGGQLGDDENFDAVVKEFNDMVASGKKKNTGNAEQDATNAFYEARFAAYKKNAPQNPLKGKGKDVNLDVPVPDGMKTSKQTMPKLDPVAEEFVRKMGMSQDKVAKILED